MTQSLTERLAERLATQSAEIERLTTSELQQLGERLRKESETALFSMRNGLHEAIGTATRPLIADLERLRAFGRWWWPALALTWLMMAALTGLLLWLWTSPTGWPGTRSTSEGIGMYQSFSFEGRTYLMLPPGTEALTCRQGETTRPCVVLPMNEGPSAPPMVRPLARPDGS